MSRYRVLATAAFLATVLTLLVGGAHAQLGDPDLAVVDVFTSDDPPTPGDAVRIEATIENQGSSQSNDFTTNFTVDGQPIGEDVDTDGLAAGDSVTVTSTSTWGVELGEHTLTAEVTHNDDSFAEDEEPGNDELSRTYTIGADLRVDSFAIDPDDVVEGEDVTFTATIENAADPDDPASDAGGFTVVFPVDGESVVSPVSIDGLAAGETETVTRTWSTVEGDAGDRSVTVEVDQAEEVDDRDRSNNEAGPRTLEVRKALPDLVVGDLSHSPDPAEPDQAVTFTATLRNNGQADAQAHNVSLVIDDEIVDTTRVESIEQGDDTNVTLSWTATAGTHDVEVTVDADEEIEETNEGNNVWTLDLPVGPDLVARELEIQPPEPRASDRVRFTAEFANEGFAIDESFQVAFDVDGTPIDTVEVDPLGADEVRNVTSVAWNATTGDHDVSVILDPEDAISELDRENNRIDRSFTVGEPQPDISVLSGSLDPAAPEAGDTVTVRSKIENAGSRDADAFTLTAEIDGEPIGERRIDGLASGEQPTIDLGEWQATNGSHSLEILADVDEEIQETDEENNRFVRHFGIGADLEMLDVTASPSDPEPGENVTVLALALNNGSVALPATNVSFHHDGNRIGTEQLDGLGPNEQGSAELTFTAARSGTIEARLDADDAIDEFDEDNNEGQASVGLASDAKPPDLTVQNVTIEGDPSADESVRFTAEIANIGEGPSPETLVSFRIDGTEIDSPVSVEGLPSEGSTQVTSAEWSPTQNEHDLEVIVDPDDSVGETDETNNAFTRSVEGGAVAIPSSPIPAIVSLLAAVPLLSWARGRKHKPPKT